MKNGSSWDEIYVKNAPNMLGVCRRYVRDLAIAEDLMHEAFIIAMQKSTTYKGNGSFEGWLRKIMVNTSLNYLRENKNIQYVSDENIDIVDNSQGEMNEISNISQKKTILAADFNQQELLEAIDELPQHHKSVFNLYVVDKFNHNEIGKMLDISTGTSKSHLSRARKKIQEFLFEKAKSKNEMKEKRHKRAMLFFLPFRENFIDIIYKKQFAHFAIQPIKSFDVATVSKEFNIPAAFNTNGSTLFKLKVITGIFLIGSIFLYFGINYFNQQKPVIKPIPEKIKIELETKNVPFPLKEKKVRNEMPNNPVKTKVEKKLPLNNVALQKVEKDNTKSNNAVALNDTLSKPKPIVIKRKIIQRDTVYVH